ncbi:MAG: SRPBCC domain-containing protein [Bacteroidota bacterium]
MLKQSIITEITIDASREKVWEILVDYDNYHTWNPFCIKAETTKEIGTPFVMTIQMHPGKKPIKSKEIYSDHEAPKVIGWRLNWGFLLKTHRLQVLEKVDEHTTHYFTEDKFWGLLTPLVMFLYRKPIQRGFDETAAALKAVCEK